MCNFVNSELELGICDFWALHRLSNDLIFRMIDNLCQTHISYLILLDSWQFFNHPSRAFDIERCPDFCSSSVLYFRGRDEAFFLQNMLIVSFHYSGGISYDELLSIKLIYLSNSFLIFLELFLFFLLRLEVLIISEAEPEKINDSFVYYAASLDHLTDINRQIFLSDTVLLLVILATTGARD